MVAKGFKNTEVGTIPNEWELDVLRNLVEEERKIRYGIVQPGLFDPNGVILIRGQDYSFGWANEMDFFRVTKELDEKFRNARVKSGDVLLTIVGNGTGNLAIVPKWILHGNITQTTARIAPNPSRLHNYYVFQFLKSDTGKTIIKNYIKGAAQPGLNIRDVEKFIIPLPPLPEQKAIAEALSDADAWIANLEQLIAKKRLIKQGAMQQLLSPKKDWEVKKLGEVAKVIGGGTPSTFNPEYWNGDIEWFTPTEVGYTKYLRSSRRKISKAGLLNSSASILPVGTLLLTSRAGIGDIGILTIEASTNQGFQSLIVNSENDNEFIYYLMLTKTALLLQNASGSTFLEISPNKVKSIDVAIPSLAEQTRIGTILSDMDNEIEGLEKQLVKARQIKQGMMQELLTGRVRLVKE